MNSKVINNAKWILICRVIQALLGFVISILSARYLGPSNFGVIHYAASIVTFVTPIMYLGINNIMVQELIIKPEDEGKLLGSSIVLNCISAFLCIIGLTAFAYVANPNDNVVVIVCALYSLLLVFQAIDMLQYWFQAKLLSKYTSIIMLFAYFITAMYKLFLLVTGKSVYWFAVSNVLDYGIIAVCLVICYKRLGGKKLSFSYETAKSLISKGKNYIVSAMMVTIFAQTDKIMIKAMIDEVAVGYYSAAVECVAKTGFIFSAIIDSMRPVIFEKKEASQKEYEHNVVLLYAIVIWLALAQSVVVTSFSKPLVQMLYGGAYLPAVSALRIVVWYSTFSYIGGIRNIWILAENKSQYLWIINLSGALCNVALNWLWIPKFGINGAAAASLITQVFTNVLIGYIIKPIRANNALMLKGCHPENVKRIFAFLMRKIKK